ncbi:hypothetical protein QYF36_008535 [Acer negundo]|nr:hypothetical protein QYF36_008535 [Acer negundo]
MGFLSSISIPKIPVEMKAGQLFGPYRIISAVQVLFPQTPSKTVVWYAFSDKPVPRGSKIQLTADRGLALDDPDGTEIWKSDIGMHQAAAGFIYDTVNFLIVDTNSEKLWQSFDHPTDTLLPTQIMERGGVVSSRRTETDFSQGRFQFRLLQDGNAVLNTINLPSGLAYDAYFWSNTFDLNRSNAGTRVVFDGSGYLYVLRQNSQRVDIIPEVIVSAKENYHRATLNFDGVFILYSHPKNSIGNGVWSAIHTMPDDIYVNNDIRKGLGSGTCGHNSICTLSEGQRPICECQKGFSLLDPNDVYGRCKSDFIQGYEEDGLKDGGDLYYVEELENTDWPTSDYEELQPSSREECVSSCLHDCLCGSAVFRVNTCWKKKLPLSYGRKDPPDNGTAFIKIKKARETKKKKEGIFILVGSVLPGSSVFINFTLVTASCLGFLAVNHKKLTRPHQVESVSHMNLHCFTYKELDDITHGFKEELGRGAFGTVYKGFMKTDSDSPIAVKNFGVLLLEIISLRRSVDKDSSTVEKAILTDWACDCYQERKLGALMENDPEAIGDMNMVERFVMVAIWCIQEDPCVQPTMRKVTQMLEGVVQVPVPPCSSLFRFQSVLGTSTSVSVS